MGGRGIEGDQNISLEKFRWSGTLLGSEGLKRATVAERVGGVLLTMTLVILLMTEYQGPCRR